MGDVPTARTEVVVLAAGLGSRLGGTVPKTLTRLVDGRTILAHQLQAVRAALPCARVHVVVGHKAALVLEAAPDVLFVYNDAYDTTNTAKSLVRALELCPDGDVLWLNGDVVLDPEVVARVVARGADGVSCVAVDTAQVGEEEVKYLVDEDGMIAALGKSVVGGMGEAVGVNLVTEEDRPYLVRRLHQVADDAYFERAIELTVEQDGCRWAPVDVSDLLAVEVDFPEDLVRADAALVARATVPDVTVGRGVRT